MEWHRAELVTSEMIIFEWLQLATIRDLARCLGL
jgi:hypothetical protein